MSKQVILNGTFDNDPSAEKTRTAFGKVNTNFTEIYTTIPQVDPSTLSGQNGKILVVNAGGTAFELAALAGGGDMLASNNLSELIATASTARTNLGLKSAATKEFIDEDSFASDSATKVPSQQSVKAYVDASVGTGYSAGAGISIASGVITNTNVSNNVTGVSLAPATGILTITQESGSVTVDLSAYIVLKIDGYQVTKGSGNTDYDDWEVGDFGDGWDASNNRRVSFKVDSLPVVSGSVLQDANLSFALNNEI